ncbi:putative mfs sugar protein [Botrytis fragariae]|uniref:Putative mfs sugar protein n=1 Tax=Botrytis fragariae TaxID=1964551 RepID=A0A8H6AIY6_9HELO|nr:putative mfs sugar protein [Botrytis fragariae]KAF5868511.1 putative mfs sugar protein [Botrytis fragariae]
MPNLEGRALFTAVTSLTCLGFLLIGYDNGLMGGLVNATGFKDTFNNPDPTIVGLIVAIYEVGCFLGSVATSLFGENIGRKKSIGIGVVIMTIGALLQASAYSRAHIIVARVVSGVGMGFINSTVPVFQAEFSPKATRGLYVCMQLSTLNFGIFLAYWVDYGFTQSYTASFSWRVPTILQCMFLVPMLVLLAIVPESPRWLAAHEKTDESLIVLARLHSHHMTEGQIKSLHVDIVRTCEFEKSLGTGSWSDLFKNDAIQSQRRFLIACAIQSFQQLGGINALIYYSNTLFSTSLGFSDHLSALMSGFLQTWFFAASFIPWLLIDRVGRRPLLLSMISVMSVVMIVQTGLIYNVQNNTSIAKGCGIGAAVMLFIFEGAFTIGFQATVWVYPSEILPLRLRQRGSSVSTACNWIFNYMIVQITPIALNNIGYKTYIVFGVLNACWIPIIFLYFPETKGLELEDVDKIFERGHGAIEGLGGLERDDEEFGGVSALDGEGRNTSSEHRSGSGSGIGGSLINQRKLGTDTGKATKEEIERVTSEEDP